MFAQVVAIRHSGFSVDWFLPEYIYAQPITDGYRNSIRDEVVPFVWDETR